MFLAKKRLMQNDENKACDITREIVSFKKKINDVIKHGIPSFWDGNGDLYS